MPSEAELQAELDRTKAQLHDARTMLSHILILDKAALENLKKVGMTPDPDSYFVKNGIEAFFEKYPIPGN